MRSTRPVDQGRARPLAPIRVTSRRSSRGRNRRSRGGMGRRPRRHRCDGRRREGPRCCAGGPSRRVLDRDRRRSRWRRGGSVGGLSLQLSPDSKALHRLVDRYQVEKIYIDPASTAWEPTSWRRRGCRWRIGRRRRCHMEQTATFLGLLSDGKVSHDGDEVLRGQAILGRMRESVTGAYFEPSARHRG